MSKIAKKGRNPGAVDCWLDSLGLYRKNVAYDETCLFRAICEQIFGGQVFHERVRKECISYARKSYEEFAHLGISQKDWFNHLIELEKHMVVCGEIELNIISRKYNRDIIIFDASKQKVFDFTTHNFPNAFLLCLLDKDHYDVVYKKDYIANAGFCQSLIYKILYENVFEISDVDEIVNNMLYDKNIITQSELDKKNVLAEGSNSASLNIEEGSDGLEEKNIPSTSVAPFPFKVAKALDPSIYRNIEYDSWGEVRREMRLGDWYYGDNKLILGTKCIFTDAYSNEKLECYIQDITRDQNKCVIYLTKSAEKKMVNYSDLSPEDGAKPWPLPYRFMKNLTVNGSASAVPATDKVVVKPKRRNKDKKRTKSESSVMSGAVPFKCEVIENIEDYIGVPAIMHNPNEMTQDHPEVSSTTQNETNMFQEGPMSSQQEQVNGNIYNWEATHWQPYMTPTPDPFVWPQGPMTHNPFNFKPMVASAPVTPNVVPYHEFLKNEVQSEERRLAQIRFMTGSATEGTSRERRRRKRSERKNRSRRQKYSELRTAATLSTTPTKKGVRADQNYPFFYNYQVEPYQTYQQWSPPPFELQAPPPPKNENEKPPQPENHCKIETQQQETATYPKKEINNNCEIQSSGVPSHDRMFTYAPQSPSVEVYPSIMPYPPGTPVLYAPAPPEMSEMVMPMAPVMYTEIPHMSPTPFIYPPTPPATWYPTGVTSQGFIFPTRLN